MAARVLLVDDDGAFSESLVGVLADEGVEVDHALTWERGVQLFRVGLHELVIADYNLPGSELGLRLLARLKPIRPSTELILISGAVTSIPALKIKESGLVDEFFVKESGDLEQLVNRAIAAQERSDEDADWGAVARAYLGGMPMDERAINDIDELLRDKMQRR